MKTSFSSRITARVWKSTGVSGAPSSGKDADIATPSSRCPRRWRGTRRDAKANFHTDHLLVLLDVLVRRRRGSAFASASPRMHAASFCAPCKTKASEQRALSSSSAPRRRAYVVAWRPTASSLPQGAVGAARRARRKGRREGRRRRASGRRPSCVIDAAHRQPRSAGSSSSRRRTSSSGDPRRRPQEPARGQQVAFKAHPHLDIQLVVDEVAVATPAHARLDRPNAPPTERAAVASPQGLKKAAIGSRATRRRRAGRYGVKSTIKMVV